MHSIKKVTFCTVLPAFAFLTRVRVCRQQQGGGGGHDAGVVHAGQQEERPHQETEPTLSAVRSRRVLTLSLIDMKSIEMCTLYASVASVCACMCVSVYVCVLSWSTHTRTHTHLHGCRSVRAARLKYS